MTSTNGWRRQFLAAVAGAGSTALLSAAAGSPPAADDTDASRTDALPMSGDERPELASFDRLMRQFVGQDQAVGAALAVTKAGRLVYARGFGFADRDRREPVSPNALFRIASISKSLTGVAVLQLIARGKLKLDDRVARLLELKNSKDPRWHEITVLELLHHTGGWDRALSFDPMFRSVKIARHFHSEPPAMPAEILRYMNEQPLDFDPGSRYAYSNFGYAVLGRIVEQASGLKYGEYVRREVLAPLGIRRSRLGATLLANRARRSSLLRSQGSHGSGRNRPDRRAGVAALRRVVPGGHGRARRLDCFGGGSGPFCLGLRPA